MLIPRQMMDPELLLQEHMEQHHRQTIGPEPVLPLCAFSIYTCSGIQLNRSDAALHP